MRKLQKYLNPYIVLWEKNITFKCMIVCARGTKKMSDWECEKM